MDYKEKIIRYMNSDEVDQQNKSMLANLFPELVKSEDEGIRKEIISHFNETIDNIRSEETVPHDAKVLVGKMQKWIDWLEKQGEQKPAEWSEEYEKLWVHDDDIFLDAAKMVVEDSPRKSYGGVHKKEIVPWFYSLKERLKSLKDRV